MRILSHVPPTLLERVRQQLPDAEIVPVPLRGEPPAEAAGEVLLTFTTGPPNLGALMRRDDPSPADIAERAEAIRAGWTDVEERRHRSKFNAEQAEDVLAWAPPVLSTEAFGLRHNGPVGGLVDDSEQYR